MPGVPKAVPDSLFSPFASQSSKLDKFSVTQRLLRENSFDHVFLAENMANRFFKIFFVRNSKKNARLGIIVGKKTLPKAVSRNRIKRIIRETFRRHSIKSSKLDVVVMVRQAYSPKVGTQVDNLEMLFSQVKNRCAE